MTGNSILMVAKMVFVRLGEDGAPQANGRRLEAADIADPSRTPRRPIPRELHVPVPASQEAEAVPP